MEVKILSLIKFRIKIPTILDFIQNLEEQTNCDVKCRMVTQMISEFILLNDQLLVHNSPSNLAAAAIYVRNRLTNQEQPWSSEMIQLTHGITENQL